MHPHPFSPSMLSHTDDMVDMALGYFSNIEFVTNLEMSFRFVREMCQFARLAVEEIQKTKENGDYMNNPAESTPLSRDNIMDMLASERLDTFSLHVRVSFFESFSFPTGKTSIRSVFKSAPILLAFFVATCFGTHESDLLL
jgi:hypothetical protein